MVGRRTELLIARTPRIRRPVPERSLGPQLSHDSAWGLIMPTYASCDEAS